MGKCEGLAHRRGEVKGQKTPTGKLEAWGPDLSLPQSLTLRTSRKVLQTLSDNVTFPGKGPLTLLSPSETLPGLLVGRPGRCPKSPKNEKTKNQLVLKELCVCLHRQSWGKLE